MKFNYLLQHLI